MTRVERISRAENQKNKIPPSPANAIFYVFLLKFTVKHASVKFDQWANFFFLDQSFSHR